MMLLAQEHWSSRSKHYGFPKYLKITGTRVKPSQTQSIPMLPSACHDSSAFSEQPLQHCQVSAPPDNSHLMKETAPTTLISAASALGFSSTKQVMERHFNPPFPKEKRS